VALMPMMRLEEHPSIVGVQCPSPSTSLTLSFGLTFFTLSVLKYKVLNDVRGELTPENYK
jgi:hypothetical protein